MTIIKPPQSFESSFGCKIFLAGSIEMDAAERWQEKAEKLIQEYEPYDTIVFNPRREFWDGTVEQSIENPYFLEQVEWELNALTESTDIIMYFDPNTKSPISLLEFGLFCKTRSIYVVCPKGFWRKGNVDIVCKKYRVPQFETLEEVVKKIFKK